MITGSSGMLGTDLARELKRGYDVVGTDMVKSPRSAVREFYKADITDRRSIAAVFRKSRPNIVVHTAAWTNVDGCELNKKKAYAINSDGARNVALSSRDVGARLIYISTDFVFDGKKKRPYKENDKTGPINVYADSKLRGERAVKKAFKEYFILRTSWLYGRCGTNFVNTIAEKARVEGSLKVVDDQAGSPTYTKDLAKAVHKLIDKMVTCDMSHVTCGDVYHVSNTGSVSWYDYARAVLKFAGIKAKVVPISSEELNRPAKRPAMSAMDNSKFRKFTGYRMRGWKSALREYLN